MNEPQHNQFQAALEELQSRYAFQEDLLQALNRTVAEQQRELDSLRQQWLEMQAVLQQAMAELEEASPAEQPPHY